VHAIENEGSGPEAADCGCERGVVCLYKHHRNIAFCEDAHTGDYHLNPGCDRICVSSPTSSSHIYRPRAALPPFPQPHNAYGACLRWIMGQERPKLTDAQRRAIRDHNDATGQRIVSRYAADLVEGVLNPIFCAAGVEELEIPPEHLVAKARGDRARKERLAQTPKEPKEPKQRKQKQHSSQATMGRRGQASSIDDMLKALVKSAVVEAIHEELPSILAKSTVSRGFSLYSLFSLPGQCYRTQLSYQCYHFNVIISMLSPTLYYDI
jgi:hypothetical protein